MTGPAIPGTVAIIQARMGSTRCPGKVLHRAAGKTLLAHLIKRVQAARSISAIVVATSDQPHDQPIADEATAYGATVFRGSESDVLGRYHRAALLSEAQTVVRITADCPLLDPAIIDEAVDIFFRVRPLGVDLVTNRLDGRGRSVLTFPDGMDVDVMPASALHEAVLQPDLTPEEREHVIYYFRRPGKRIHTVTHTENLFPHYRWTVDYPEDIALVSAVLEAMPLRFGMGDVKQFVDAHPEIAALNAHHLPARAY